MLFGRRISGTGRDAADAITPIEDADDAALRELFSRALADDPSDRFETALAFAEALHGVLSQPAPAKNGKGRKKRDTDSTLSGRSASARRRGLPLEPEDQLPLSVDEDERATDRIQASEEVVTVPEVLPPPAVVEPILAADVERDREVGLVACPHPKAPPEASDDVEERSIERDSTMMQPPVAAQMEVDSAALLAANEPDALERSVFGDLDLKNAEDERYTLAESESALPDTAAPEATAAPDATTSSTSWRPVMREHNRTSIRGPLSEFRRSSRASLHIRIRCRAWRWSRADPQSGRLHWR